MKEDQNPAFCFDEVGTTTANKTFNSICFRFLLFSSFLIVTLNSPSHIHFQNETKDILYSIEIKTKNWIFCLLLLCRVNQNKMPDSVLPLSFTYITLFCSFSKLIDWSCLHFAHFLTKKQCYFVLVCLDLRCVQSFISACLILHFPHLILHFPRLILHFPCLILHSRQNTGNIAP